jgi:hypothetical protein
MSKTRRESHADRIGDKDHHDWYLRSRIFYGTCGLRRKRYDEIGLGLYEMGGEYRKFVKARTRFLAVDDDRCTFHPSKFAEALPKSIKVGSAARRSAQHPDAW